MKLLRLTIAAAVMLGCSGKGPTETEDDDDMVFRGAGATMLAVVDSPQTTAGSAAGQV